MRASGVALALLLLLTAAQAAPPMDVRHQRIPGAHAERLELDAALLVQSTGLARAPAALPATPPPTELAEAPLPATAGVAEGHWSYSAVLRERAPDAVPSGRYVARLLLDGEPAGEVALEQALPDPLAEEGALVAFDLGPDLPAAPLLVLLVLEVTEGAVRLDSALDASLRYVWRDAGGRDNPELTAEGGRELRLRVRNPDGSAPHNLRILGPDGRPVAGPTQDVSAAGDEVELRWTPQAAGDHAYECQYHATMRGTLRVEPSR